jgi:hypothetical protein
MSSIVAAVEFSKINADLRLTEDGKYLALLRVRARLITRRLEQYHS